MFYLPVIFKVFYYFYFRNMLENNLKNATQQLENLYKLKTKKEIEENAV